MVQMNKCPECSTQIEDSFGLVECPGCKKILFADFDGSLKVHEENSVVAPMEQETVSFGEEVFEAAPLLEQSSESFNEDWSAPPLDELDPAVESRPEETPVVEEAQLENIVASAGDVVVEDPVVVPSEEAPASEDMIEEINQFANSEVSSLKDGSLTYSVTIKNIDTEDIKDEILEVLRDKRLNIDIKGLKFSLPTLELKNLNAVKASVIVSKIKHLPVDVEWKQRSEVLGEGSES